MTDLLKILKKYLVEQGEVTIKNENEIVAIGEEIEDGVLLMLEIESERLFIHYLEDQEEVYVNDILSSIFNILEQEEEE